MECLRSGLHSSRLPYSLTPLLPLAQELYPRHGVQKTWGAEAPKDLAIKEGDAKIYKGTKPNLDSDSAFFDRLKANDTGLYAAHRRHLHGRPPPSPPPRPPTAVTSSTAAVAAESHPHLRRAVSQEPPARGAADHARLLVRLVTRRLRPDQRPSCRRMRHRGSTLTRTTEAPPLALPAAHLSWGPAWSAVTQLQIPHI